MPSSDIGRITADKRRKQIALALVDLNLILTRLSRRLLTLSTYGIDGTPLFHHIAVAATEIRKALMQGEAFLD